jgi:DnaJ-class molecular chaperone
LKSLLRKLSRWIHDQEACFRCKGSGRKLVLRWRGENGETESVQCSECGGDGIQKERKQS